MNGPIAGGPRAAGPSWGLTMNSYPEPALLIGGKWVRPPGRLPVVNPADDSVLGAIPVARRSDLDDALTAAEQGSRLWRRSPPAEREAVMLRAAGLLRERLETIATVMTLEQGKTLRESRLEVLRAAGIIEWDAGEARRLYGRVIPAGPDLQHTVLHQPIGVVAAFSPWNFPVNGPARKIAGAVAAGCSIILKPSEETPGSAFLLAQAFQDAGLPDGVLNLVFGDPAEISGHLVPHPVVDMVSLTGSTAVGRQVGRLAAEGVKPALLELGGHAPVIVCADADPAQAAGIAITGKARNSGQVCVSPTRFFVDELVYEPFVAEFGRLAERLKIGNGLAEDTDLAPLANRRRVEAIAAMVEDCRSQGARLVSGGYDVGGAGNHLPLTVFADVPSSARAMREEPFGPLALIASVTGLDDAIARANAVPYGLAAYAFTDRASTMRRLAEDLRCGNLAVNHVTASFADTPFGGVGESGYGREGGVEGVQSYTVAKLVSVRTAPT